MDSRSRKRWTARLDTLKHLRCYPRKRPSHNFIKGFLARAVEGMISRYRKRKQFMAQMVVRNLDENVKAKLQQRARQHGRSTEEEVREILRDAVRNEQQKAKPLGKRLRALFSGIGLEEDILEWRSELAKPANFDDTR